MTEALNTLRPKWLKVFLGVVCAWTTFMLMLIFLLTTLWLIQVKLMNIEIVGIPATIILIILIGISGLSAYKITKWQNNFLDKKLLSTSYIVLILLILASMLTIPTIMTYTLF